MNTEAAIMLIRYSVAITMVLFGISQMLNPGKWLDYIPEFLKKISPMQPETTMRLHSVGNLVLGVWLASGISPVVALWVNIIWWVSILPFALIKDWTIALRDICIIAALAAILFLL